ncbi:hypothetical protein BDZ85DRAFT_197139 [Elsinoe ampelina]|uniref:YCII-related domain-containing protein n=1 Tax=Elsinoe ampelina TaxID=302913 RepID=A0A6A6GCN6_9PEZI|nr:hypothetical protein BDZ85DRAFT_197139 [Elsinoe ampelina]
MAAQNEWLVLMKDKPNSLEARMKVRPQHLEELKPQVESGLWVFGGATLNAPPSDGKLDIYGSCMLGIAETKEEILNRLKQDVYAKSGVWDIENVQIIPFKCAVRKPL